MAAVQPSLNKLIQELHEFNFSDGSISLLKDKKFEEKNFERLLEIMKQPDLTFEERRKKIWIEKSLDRGDSEEITTGRYERYVEDFKDISSEQALVKGRMKFAVEYVIRLADLLYDKGYTGLVKAPFTLEEKTKLRVIYKDFNIKDFLAVKEIEGKTKHDIVAANAWVTIRAQMLGMDDDLMRGLTHLARTSADVNSNVIGELYTSAMGKWVSSIVDLLHELRDRSYEYSNVPCVAETHGQDAQLTTVGHIYANLAQQIMLFAKPLLGDEIFKLDGKIAGAIGTDVDMKAAFPEIDPTSMYEDLVREVFGLNYVRYGNDQDCVNASLCRALDTMVNVSLVVEKAATDTWLYCSRGILSKMTKSGESGSSIMPQKTNPFLAEGCEALTNIAESMVLPIKKMIVAYREQGDLRRSITKREGFHPIMLSTIAVRRLIDELKKYKANVDRIDAEINYAGPKIVSSAINSYLRANGVADAYDSIKKIVMKPYVTKDDVNGYITKMEKDGKITGKVSKNVREMLLSVIDGKKSKKGVLGTAIEDTHQMHYNAGKGMKLLSRYC